MHEGPQADDRRVGTEACPGCRSGSGGDRGGAGWKAAAWFAVPVLAVGVGVAFAMFGPADVMRENGPVEQLQDVGWGLAAMVAWFSSTRLRTRQARLWLIGMGVVAAAALARERDMHILLNPETIGAWGVRYRIDWWTDPAVPLGLKAAWALVAAAGATALFAPLIGSHLPWSRRFRGGLAVNALLAIAMLGVLGGWASDDIFRDAVVAIKAQALAFEETSELMAPWTFLACIALVASRGGFGRASLPHGDAEDATTPPPHAHPALHSASSRKPEPGPEPHSPRRPGAVSHA